MNIINLTPPGEEDRAELRDDGLDNVLVEAIDTIRAAVASAAGEIGRASCRERVCSTV